MTRTLQKKDYLRVHCDHDDQVYHKGFKRTSTKWTPPTIYPSDGLVRESLRLSLRTRLQELLGRKVLEEVGDQGSIMKLPKIP